MASAADDLTVEDFSARSASAALAEKHYGNALLAAAQSNPDIAKANIDLSKTYTNQFVEQAMKATN